MIAVGLGCEPLLVQEPEDELFWDYGPPARQANGTASTAAAKQNGAKSAAAPAKPSPPAAPKPSAPPPEQVHLGSLFRGCADVCLTAVQMTYDAEDRPQLY